jgi:hypothetical protein
MSGGHHIAWECADEPLDAHIDRAIVNGVEVFRHRIPSATTYTVHGVAFAGLSEAIAATTGGRREGGPGSLHDGESDLPDTSDAA